MINASMTLTEMRICFLRDMDTYVRKNCHCDYYLYWIAHGLPDGWDETDLKEIAEDDELWLDCISAFNIAISAQGLTKQLIRCYNKYGKDDSSGNYLREF